MHDEAVLIASIRAGDGGAFAVVVERYQARIARYLGRLVGDRATAEDLTQETFLNAYRAIRKIDSPLALGPWLYRIATNQAYMHFRRARLRRLLPFREERHGGAGPGPEEAALERDLVRRALARLPREYAAPLLLHMAEGFRHQEVGAILGISAEAARKRVARGSEMFRKAYAELEVGDA